MAINVINPKKNYLRFKQASGTYQSVDWTVDDDGVITLNGLADGTGAYNPISCYVTLPAGDYTFTSLNQADSINTQQLYASWQDGSGDNRGTGSLNKHGTTTFTLTQTTTIRFYCFFYGGNNYDHLKIYPMVIEGTYTYETVPSFVKSVGRLPSAYQEVEYIESQNTAGDSSGSYINTAYIPNENSKLVADVQFLSYAPTQSQYGSGSTASSSTLYGRFMFGVYQTGFCFGLGNQINFNISDATVLTQRHIFTIDLLNNKAKVDNIEYTGFAGFGSNPEKGEFTIFARNVLGDMRNFAHSRCYNLKFYENNSLVRDFIPCYRKVDNVAGFYDLANDVFYTNSGTGSFVIGGIVVGYDIQRCKVNILKNRLPAEYQEVEYIESSGSQWINTGVKLSSSDTVNCKFEITASTITMGDAIYGSYNNPNFFVLLMRNPNTARVGTSSNQATSTNYTLNTIYDTSLTNGRYIENSTTYNFSPISDFTMSTSCYIMSRNQAGTVYPVSAKVYAFEIVGKFNGIPCYRKTDNVIGMYDTISETFFTNAGTGDFTKGSDVSGIEIQRVRVNLLKSNHNYHNLPSEYQEVEYIESTGTQYIDTGIYPTNNTVINWEINPNSLIGAIYGARTSNSDGGYYWAFDLSGNPSEMYCQYGSNHYHPNQVFSINTWHTLTQDSNQISVDGNIISTFTSQTFTTQSTLFLYNRNVVNYSSGYFGSFKGKKCVIYNNGTQIRNFVPCYRKADGEIGMYDIVNDIFYTNAGTGTFLKGNDVQPFEIIKI